MRHFRFRRIFLAAGLALVMASSAAFASPTLRNGSHGNDVLLLQQKLKSIGYDISSTDGVFGSETERAVTAFQKDQRIKATGIVNSATWRALKNSKARPSSSKAKPAQGKPAVSAASKLQMAPSNKTILEKKNAAALIATAKKYIGTPYQFGGTTPKGFDCSGYIQYIFAAHGIGVPRLADEQYRLGEKTVSKKQLVPGDLVFFNTYGSGISHIGLYLGDGQFIHASSSKGIRIDALSNEYWAPRYIGGKHIVK